MEGILPLGLGGKKNLVGSTGKKTEKGIGVGEQRGKMASSLTPGEETDGFCELG